MKYLLTLALSLVLTLGAFAQTENVQVDITKLTQQELLVYQQLKQKQASAGINLDSLTPENVDKYAQMGKALGTAVNEGLGAVTKNVDQFSQTSAGKLLMVLITWKVMGNDAITLAQRTVRWTVGIGLLTFGVPFFIYIYRRNCTSRPILVSATKVGFLTVKREYKGMSTPLHDAEGQWGYAVCFGIFVFICVAIMFF